MKAETCSKRGKEIRRRMEEASAISKNDQAFLSIDVNKTELFCFLALRVAKIETSKEVVITHSYEVLCINHSVESGLAPRNHEETKC